MITFLFDGTKNGMLTCIFESFYKKIKPDNVTSGEVQCGFSDEIITIETDNEKAERVLKCLKNCKTKYLLSDFNLSLKSGESGRFKKIFDYLHLAVANKNADISTAFSSSEVLSFSDMKNRICYETHRFKGFLRFMEAKQGFFYAIFEPDNDITEMLVPHFKARLRSPFAIHDVKRNILALCDGKNYKIYNAGDNLITVYISESEKQFQDLWKLYYKSVNIEERENIRQMDAYMPKRHRKHMPEKCEKTEGF